MEVSFGFRFDRDPDVHRAAVELRERLAIRYAGAVTGKRALSRVEFYPVARAGNSGSEVYYCDLYFEDLSVPRRHIAKFQNREHTQQEFEAASEARIARMCTEPSKVLDEREDLGMIVYDLAKAPDHQEFRGLFLDPLVDTEFCRKALSSAFRNVGRTYNEAEEQQTVFADFNRYLQRRSNPVGKMRALTSAPSEWKSIASRATEVLDALDRIRADTKHKVRPCLVHGDLHARNLVIDIHDARQTELIDFDWVHWGHPGKDLALMEASIKYMLLPEIIQQRLGTSEALTFNAVDAIEAFLAEHGLDLPEFAALLETIPGPPLPISLQDVLARTYACVRQVRKSAKIVLIAYCSKLGSSNPAHEYALSLFLMTLGIFGIQETERFWALSGLNRLAKILEAE